MGGCSDQSTNHGEGKRGCNRVPANQTAPVPNADCRWTTQKIPTHKFLWLCCEKQFTALNYVTSATTSSVNNDKYRIIIGFVQDLVPECNKYGNNFLPRFTTFKEYNYNDNYNHTWKDSISVPLRTYFAATGIQCTNLIQDCQLQLWDLLMQEN